jgi:di/tricarboxylate transporter
LFPPDRPFQPLGALASLSVFVGVVAIAALGLAPIAATAFSGAVLLVLLRVISVDDAYRGLRPEVLFLIAGMVVIGLSLEITGLASSATNLLVGGVRSLGPLFALALLYGATLLLTEILSNAAVAVLLTPVAVALAESLGVSPRPFLVAVMMAASAAFATPFGYQTNVLVYQLGRYSYLDFVKIGAPLNILTWAVGVAIIPHFFPF